MTIPCLLVAVLIAGVASAQSRETDFSGHWVLVISDRGRSVEPDTLMIDAPDQLLVRQSSQSITVEHPSRRGTHPAAGTFEFGAGGFVGDRIRRAEQGRWDTTFFGTQMMMSTSTTSVAKGIETTVAHGSFWLLDQHGRLFIEFREHRSHEHPKVATRVYVRKQ